MLSATAQRLPGQGELDTSTHDRRVIRGRPPGVPAQSGRGAAIGIGEQDLSRRERPRHRGFSRPRPPGAVRRFDESHRTVPRYPARRIPADDQDLQATSEPQGPGPAESGQRLVHQQRVQVGYDDACEQSHSSGLLMVLRLTPSSERLRDDSWRLEIEQWSLHRWLQSIGKDRCLQVVGCHQSASIAA